MKNLFLGVCLAPYRIDFYNSLYKNLVCDIYFRNHNLISQKFDMNNLRKEAIFPELYLQTKKIGKRKIIINLRRLIKDKDPDIIFTPEFSLTTIQVLLIKKFLGSNFKVVSICDDSLDMIKGNDFSLVHKIARKLLTPFLDNLIVVNNETCNWYQKKYGKGIWFPIISDETKMRAKYEKLLPLSQKIYEENDLISKKIILFVGRLVALKNLHTLIQAYQKIHDKETVLVIIGDGEKKEALQSLSQGHMSIIFTGRLEGDELYAWYNIGDIFVLPSTQESFGTVTNEALTAGCRCLISEKAGSECLINSKNGNVFDPYDVHTLSKLLDANLDKIDSHNKIILKPNLMPMKFKETLSAALAKI